MPLPNRAKFFFSASFLEWADRRIAGDPYEQVASLIADAESVVDLCCGTGYGARRIATRNPRSSVLGFDLSPELVGAGSRLIRLSGHANVVLRVGDVRAVDLPAHSQQSVTIFFGLHELAEPIRKAALGEALRLLVPGGVIAIADLDYPRRYRWVFCAYAFLSSGRRPWGVIGSALQDGLEAAGFTNVVRRPSLGKMLPYQIVSGVKPAKACW